MELKALVEQLEAVEKNCENDYSLYNGKTGLCLAYYLLGALLNEESCLNKAKELLDETGENIDKIQGFNFENGLAGIGWAIEWLIQNKLLAANSDEVLEDMDDEIYKTVVYSKSQNPSLKNGTLGKALFFYRRLIARNPNSSRYRNICNQECLILLIDELNDILLNDEKEISYNETLNDPARLYELAESFLFLAKINHLKINTEISKRIICATAKFIDRYFLSEEFRSAKPTDSNLHLIYACYKAGSYLNDDSLIVLATDAYFLYMANLNDHDVISIHSKLIIQKLSEQTCTSQLLNKLDDRFAEASVFSFLKSISTLPGAAKFDWEEGWGL